MIFLTFGIASAQDVLQVATDQATLQDGMEKTCAPIPGEPDLTERLADAHRFAIPLAENLNSFEELIGNRAQHFFSVAPALSINGESFQRFDFRMITYTAPADVNASRIADVLTEFRDASGTQGSSEFDLTWLWGRIHESHPIGEVDIDWACMRSSPRARQHLVVLLGYGQDVCGILERAADLEEARSMAKSLGLTQISLERLKGSRAAIRGTALDAALYSIQDIAYFD
ncbi:MAG: hypothetical protein HND55_03975 [Pseudomonadota bacterium]|nr:MAG: hypothetical protein HND55_03975 [Pseudomonadota bacterium]